MGLSQLLQGLNAIVDERSRVLVLGSMPSTTSLAQQRYYAHRRNAFWPLMADLLGVDAEADYPQRLCQLSACGVALWDVLFRCRRRGSLDSSIARASEVPSDIPQLLETYPGLDCIACNGHKSWHSLQRFYPHIFVDKQVLRLPSTSPANATLNYRQKLSAWRVVADRLQRSQEVSL